MTTDHDRTPVSTRPTPAAEVEPYGTLTEQDLTSAIGRAGIFQKVLFAYQLITMACYGLHSFLFMLAAEPVDHWCASPRGTNLSTEEWKNLSIPMKKDGTYSQCFMYDQSKSDSDSYNETRAQVPCKTWEYDETRRRGIIRDVRDFANSRSRAAEVVTSDPH